MKAIYVECLNDEAGNAAKSGIKATDCIVACDSVVVNSIDDLVGLMADSKKDALRVTVLREGRLIDLKVDNQSLGVRLKEKEVNITSEYIRNYLVSAEIKISTTATIHGYNITENVDVITSECVFGINVIGDFLAAASDVFGGRNSTTQNALKEARVNCLNELRREAIEVGANGVVGIDLDYSEMSGGGKSMLFLVASGTAVKIAPISE